MNTFWDGIAAFINIMTEIFNTVIVWFLLASAGMLAIKVFGWIWA